MNPGYKVLIIGTVWPEPASSAAGSRMMQLINIFRQQHWQVTFASAAADSEYAEDIQKKSIHKVSIELNNASFDAFIKQLQPDVVLFDRFMTEEQYGWRVSEYCSNALKILDTEDLHCLRYAREKAFKQNKPFVHSDLINEVSVREIAAIYRCDISLIISEQEMQILVDFFKVDEALLHYIPFVYDTMHENVLQELPSYTERSGFISVGNFLHEPNRNAVMYLKETIWPLIRKKIPHAEVYVYGAYPTAQILQMDKPSAGFFVKGRITDATKVMSNARVNLAPLRIGAGLKGKLTEAMLCGTPSVTTTIGAEGMNGALPWNGYITDDAEKFTAAAVSLYKDENFWKEQQYNGLNIINQRFSIAGHLPQLVNKIRFVKQNLPAYRENNFIGTVLAHHALASTKYMGKWIEEKNKRA